MHKTGPVLLPPPTKKHRGNNWSTRSFGQIIPMGKEFRVVVPEGTLQVHDAVGNNFERLSPTEWICRVNISDKLNVIYANGR